MKHLLQRRSSWVAFGTVAVLLTATVSLMRPVSVAAQESTKKTLAPDKAEIGKPVKDFALRDILAAKKSKATIKLSDYKGKKTVVAIFVQQNCGTTWAYEKKMGALLKDYAKKDVVILAVHCSYLETDDDIKGMFEQRNLSMPVLDDKEKQEFTRYFGAQATPTFVVIDKEMKLRYIGSFDKSVNDTTAGYVRPAVEATLTSKEIAKPQTRAFG